MATIVYVELWLGPICLTVNDDLEAVGRSVHNYILEKFTITARKLVFFGVREKMEMTSVVDNTE